MIEKPLEVVDGRAMAERIVQGAAAPQRPIGIRAVVQEPMHAIIVMPVELAGEHQADGVLGELTAFDQDDGAVVERLRRMVGNFAIIGIRAALDLPASAFTYLASHGSLDIEHVRMFEGLMNRLDDANDQAAVIETARAMYRLYGDVFRSLPGSAGAAAREIA